MDHIGLSGLTVGELIESLDRKTVSDQCGRVWPGLRSVLREANNQNEPFSHVIILAGTNDLVSERYGFRSPEDILKVGISATFLALSMCPVYHGSRLSASGTEERKERNAERI